MAILTVIWYRNFMDQVSSISKLSGRAGSLIAIVGLAVFFSGVFSFTPRIFVLVGVALFALALTAFVIEEFGPRR